MNSSPLLMMRFHTQKIPIGRNRVLSLPQTLLQGGGGFYSKPRQESDKISILAEIYSQAGVFDTIVISLEAESYRGFM